MIRIIVINFSSPLHCREDERKRVLKSEGLCAVMNLKVIAAKIYLPPGLKFKGLLNMYAGMVLNVHREMNNGDRASEIFRKAMAEVGTLSAHTLKKELNLQDTFEDAVNSWIIGSKALNITISLERKDDEVVFNHVYCPLWEHFREKGTILCEDACIPVAEAIAKEICPDVKVSVVRKPDDKHTCIKALKREK